MGALAPTVSCARASAFLSQDRQTRCWCWGLTCPPRHFSWPYCSCCAWACQQVRWTAAVCWQSLARERLAYRNSEIARARRSGRHGQSSSVVKPATRLSVATLRPSRASASARASRVWSGGNFRVGSDVAGSTLDGRLRPDLTHHPPRGSKADGETFSTSLYMFIYMMRACALVTVVGARVDQRGRCQEGHF